MVTSRHDAPPSDSSSEPGLADLASEALALAGRVSVRLGHRPTPVTKPGDQERSRG